MGMEGRRKYSGNTNTAVKATVNDPQGASNAKTKQATGPGSRRSTHGKHTAAPGPTTAKATQEFNVN